ncbi:hypothetical protein BX070DRAFT_35335 [Coemansia spiralis]|nr:hypothetical protein BX070DRAFT_35335 [Coemansia spiralis]
MHQLLPLVRPLQTENGTAGVTESATLANGLTREQQDRVDLARAYAQELQQTVFKDLLEAERKKKEEQSKPPPGTVNPGLLSGLDPRNVSVMSRLYVGSINFELTDEHIHRVFSEFGPVRSVSMSKDPVSGRHKGFGFVEYDVPEAATLAMEVMNGTILGGRQLKIGRPNNYAVAVAQGFEQPPSERIYVANINEAIAEDVLKEIFAPFGEVRECVLAPDIATRKHKGWGFIEFADTDAAEQAAVAMNGFSLGNLVLRVRKCVVGGPIGDGMAALDALPQEDAANPAVSSLQAGAAGLPQPAVRPPQQVMEVAASINKSIIGAADSATASTTGAQATNGLRDAQQNAINIGSESPVVLLQNVVGNREEVDDDLAADMAGEGLKCGQIVKVVVHIGSPQELGGGGNGITQNGDEVSIFIHFADVSSTTKAVELFDGRWFGGRRVSAKSFDFEKYRVLTCADTMMYIP